MSILRRELFNIWINAQDIKNKSGTVIEYVMSKIGSTEEDNNEKYKKAKQKVHKFVYELRKKWTNAKRTRIQFEAKYEKWLNGALVFEIAETGSEVAGPSASVNYGPTKDFAEKSKRTQLLNVSSLVKAKSCDELVLATKVSLYKSGKRDAAKMLKELNASPTRATKIKKAIFCPPNMPIPYAPEEALALFIDGDYSKHSYQLMQAGAKNRNANIYPTYHVVKSAKEKCYPSNMTFSDVSAQVSLQCLVDKTVERLGELQIDLLEQTKPNEMYMTYKWGCDGSSGHSNYKQKFTDTKADNSDQHLFAVCLVPLQLKSNNVLLWQNSSPSSTRFCRPIKIIFEKESKALIKQEISIVENQIAEILPTKIIIGSEEVMVHHNFLLTMIDGKVFSTISDSSSQTCGICGATPSIMNDLGAIAKLSFNQNLYKFGISILHAWIRCFECVLHISYKLVIKRWKPRNAEEKDKVETQKKTIKENFKSQMHLLVDAPKPGMGSTNDGNTARRFFSQTSLASSVTGVSEVLIKRLQIILRVMSCGYTVNVAAFRRYLSETAKLYVELYPWYYMPSSLHKILIHGADIIQQFSLPIGMISEEALESRNKDMRNVREFHTRKISREKTMQDLFQSLIVSSDPVISSISKKSFKHRNSEPLCADVISLLSEPILQEMENMVVADYLSDGSSD